MSPRTITLPASARPQDPAFAFYVKFYLPRIKGVRSFWTDSREEAEKFASRHRCYARPAVVQPRSDWAIGRGIALTETNSATLVVT
jgi:hypothetical protein